ncbi:MAG: hypothetical protein ACTSO9_17245 [Candidatus Helarchaeota archaeon]
MPKPHKEKSLEEIYKEAREKEGPVVIPPQVDFNFLDSLKDLTKIETFGELLKEFQKYQKLAAKKPGKIIEGNMILGAPAPEYYDPSEEEKRLVEIGRKIVSVLNSLNKKNVKNLLKSMIRNEIFVDQIVYQDIHFFHVDVVGSGRFIYPQISWDTVHSVLDSVYNAVGKKSVKKSIDKIKTALNEPKFSPSSKKEIFSLKIEEKPDKEKMKYRITKTIFDSKDKNSIQKIKELFENLLNFINKFHL